MRLNRLLFYTWLLLVVNVMCLTDGKKILLGIIGLHALRRMHGLQHMHNFVSYYMPLRYAAQAWRGYGKTAAHTPNLSYLSGGAATGYQHKASSGGDYESHDSYKPNTMKLSAEQSYELDQWLSHYYPEDTGASYSQY